MTTISLKFQNETIINIRDEIAINSRMIDALFVEDNELNPGIIDIIDDFSELDIKIHLEIIEMINLYTPIFEISDYFENIAIDNFSFFSSLNLPKQIEIFDWFMWNSQITKKKDYILNYISERLTVEPLEITDKQERIYTPTLKRKILKLSNLDSTLDLRYIDIRSFFLRLKLTRIPSKINELFPFARKLICNYYNVIKDSIDGDGNRYKYLEKEKIFKEISSDTVEILEIFTDDIIHLHYPNTILINFPNLKKLYITCSNPSFKNYYPTPSKPKNFIISYDYSFVSLVESLPKFSSLEIYQKLDEKDDDFQIVFPLSSCPDFKGYRK